MAQLLQRIKKSFSTSTTYKNKKEEEAAKRKEEREKEEGKKKWEEEKEKKAYLERKRQIKEGEEQKHNKQIANVTQAQKAMDRIRSMRADDYKQIALTDHATPLPRLTLTNTTYRLNDHATPTSVGDKDYNDARYTRRSDSGYYEHTPPKADGPSSYEEEAKDLGIAEFWRNGYAPLKAYIFNNSPGSIEGFNVKVADTSESVPVYSFGDRHPTGYAKHFTIRSVVIKDGTYQGHGKDFTTAVNSLIDFRKRGAVKND